VPLHRESEGPSCHLDGLDGSILGEADGRELLPDPIDGLVVVAEAGAVGSEDRSRQAAGLKPEPVALHLPGRDAVLRMSDHLR
jgi:hypothetical protein